MAYDKKKIFELAKQMTVQHRLFFIEEIVSYLPCTKTTFYEFFPLQSDEMDAIKEIIEKNKIITKTSLRSKWYNSGHFPAEVALYKIIGTDEEAHRLNGSRQEIDHSSKGEKIAPVIINLGGGINPEEDEE